jgi:hypothetical protein
MTIFVVIFVSCIIFGLPGVLIHLSLKEKGFHLIPCLGIGLSFIVVLYSTVASVIGYSYYLQLGITIVLDIILLVHNRSKLRNSIAWTNRLESWQWLLLSLITLVYVGPAFVIPVPFDTDAQGFGLLIATVRASGSINNLAPFYPEVGWYYSPAFFLIGAELADLTGAGIHEVMLGFSHLLSLGVIASIGSLGMRMGGSKTGWWATVASAAGLSLYTTLMDSAYTNLLGIWLTATFLWMLGQVMSRKSDLNLAIAGICLSAVLLGHPDSIIHLILAYLCFYLTAVFVRPRFNRKEYLSVMIIVPVIGVIVSLPWLFSTFSMLGQISVHERQSPQLHHLLWVFIVNGGLVPFFALLGVWWASRRRHWLDIWSISWLVPIVEISSLGNLDALSRRTLIDPLQIFYPLGMAWHATIIPIALLAARGLEPIGDWIASKRFWKEWLVTILSIMLFLGGIALMMNKSVVSWTRTYVPQITGALATPADVHAYQWLRDNSPSDSKVLNYPGRYEGQWAPVISERTAVYIRDQLFYIGADNLRNLQHTMTVAFLDPSSDEAYDLIVKHEIDYVVVPQWFNVSGILQTELRWREPDKLPQASLFKDADYLDMVANFDGAQVWQVKY